MDIYSKPDLFCMLFFVILCGVNVSSVLSERVVKCEIQVHLTGPILKQANMHVSYFD